MFSNDNYSRAESNNKHFLLNNFDTKTYLLTLPIPKYDCKAIASNSKIYVTCRFKDFNRLYIVKYSFFFTKTWNKLPILRGVNKNYKVCSLMQNVFVISETANKLFC